MLLIELLPRHFAKEDELPTTLPIGSKWAKSVMNNCPHLTARLLLFRHSPTASQIMLTCPVQYIDTHKKISHT